MKTCEETQQWVDAYLDGELDPIHSVEIERHLQACAVCAKVFADERTLVRAIGAAPRYAMPAALRERIDVALRAEAGEEAVEVKAVSFREALRAEWRRWARAVATLATPRPAWGQLTALATVLVFFCATLAGTWIAARRSAGDDTRELLAREIVASHVRSLMSSRLTDVVSTDRHTVKPWFNGKLGFSPTVADFSSAGFPLAGGRLDYVDERPAAAIVYQCRKHVINVFVQSPAGSLTDDRPPETLACRGYHLRHWTQGGMSFWAVSDLNEADLQKFVELMRQAGEN